MNQQNPYMNLYLNILNKTQQTVSKEYLFTLAINLGHVHNVLGVMISDVVNLMGKVSLNNPKKQDNLDSSLADKQISNQQIPIKNKNQNINKKIKIQTKSNQYIPQKMEIQNLSIDQFNDKVKSDQLIKKQFTLKEFQFNEKQQSNHHFKNSAFTKLIYADEQKKEQKQEDQVSTGTISAQKVRYNQKYENQFQNLSFGYYDLKDYEKQEKYQVKVENFEQKQKSNKKYKSAFFDLFDSSQTNSYPQEDNETDLKFTPISQQKTYKEKNSYNIVDIKQKSNSISNNYLKPKPVSYSTQIKDDKDHSKTYNNKKVCNLLEEPFSVNSSRSGLNDIDEIDEIESSRKKIPQKIVIKKKNEDKRPATNNDAQFDEYVPRRQDIGRKKVNRENVKGSQCPDCKAFYEAISDDSNSFKALCECTSRHKSNTTFMKKHKVQNYSQAFSLD